MKIRPVGAEIFDADWRTDRQTWWSWCSLSLNFAKRPENNQQNVNSTQSCTLLKACLLAT